MRVIKNKNNFKLGDQIQLNLMFKSKQKNFNALIMPIGVFDQYKFDINTKSSDDKQFRQNLFTNLNKKYLNCEQYFKLNCKCANDIYENVLVREKNELKTQIEEEKHQPEVCFADEHGDSKLFLRLGNSHSFYDGSLQLLCPVFARQDPDNILVHISTNLR